MVKKNIESGIIIKVLKDHPAFKDSNGVFIEKDIKEYLIFQ